MAMPPSEKPRSERHQRWRTGLAAVRLVLWLGWMAWLIIDDHSATP
jgi:hypothetical protein